MLKLLSILEKKGWIIQSRLEKIRFNNWENYKKLMHEIIKSNICTQEARSKIDQIKLPLIILTLM